MRPRAPARCREGGQPYHNVMGGKIHPEKRASHPPGGSAMGSARATQDSGFKGNKTGPPLDKRPHKRHIVKWRWALCSRVCMSRCQPLALQFQDGVHSTPCLRGVFLSVWLLPLHHNAAFITVWLSGNRSVAASKLLHRTAISTPLYKHRKHPHFW